MAFPALCLRVELCHERSHVYYTLPAAHSSGHFRLGQVGLLFNAGEGHVITASLVLSREHHQHEAVDVMSFFIILLSLLTTEQEGANAYTSTVGIYKAVS